MTYEEFLRYEIPPADYLVEDGIPAALAPGAVDLSGVFGPLPALDSALRRARRSLLWRAHRFSPIELAPLGRVRMRDVLPPLSLLPDEDALVAWSNRAQPAPTRVELLRLLLGAIAQRPERRYVLYADIGDCTIGPSSRAGAPALHDVAAVLPENVVALFARNANADDPRIVSVPLGLPREAPPRLAAALAAHAPADPSRRKLAHAKFRLRYERPKLERGRRQIAAVVRKKPWIDQDLRRKQLPPDEYYRALLEHRFVISPEGCGIDCLRTWEALYCKCIPIVQRSRHMEAFADLPILFTTDYSELTPEYLEAEHERILATEYDFDKLRIGYWRDLIVQAWRGLEA